MRWRFTLLTLLIVATITVAGLALRWRANRNLTAVKAKVQGVLDQEMWALESGNQDLYMSLLDQRAPAAWRQRRGAEFDRHAGHEAFTAEVAELTLIQPDLALVEVRIDPPDGPVYRETRAYRQAGSTWQRTPAPPRPALALSPRA